MGMTVDDTTGTAGIMELAQGFWASRALLSAVELDLFATLAEGPLTGEALRGRLGLHPRAAADFLDSLVGLGLLRRDGDEYRNGGAAARHLAADGPGSLTGRLRLLAWRYRIWGDLTSLLRTGDQQAHRGGQDFQRFYGDQDALRRFMAAMDANNAEIGPALADALDWSGHTSFVDVGGARGNLAADLVRAHPHLRAGCLDLPPVEPLFDEHMERLGLTGKVDFHPADFFADPLPETEVMVFGHVLHDWNDKARVRLLRRAHDALPEGGRVVVYDALVGDGRDEPANLLRSLNMRLVTPGGSEYTPRECRAWLAAAGFEDVTVAPLVGVDSVVVARKAKG